jgi:archaemetzincin
MIVRLVPVALQPTELGLLSWLGAALTRTIGLSTVLAPGIPISPGWRTGRGAPLSSADLIDYLIERYPEAHLPGTPGWTLALTIEDLCAPERAFVFGEATLGGAWAVVSTFRLGAFGSVEDPLPFRARLLKEAVHELGHLAGLPHCRQPDCVMAESPMPRDIDRKGVEFCDHCRTLFHNTLVVGSDDA